jgi:hypothetical protein
MLVFISPHYCVAEEEDWYEDILDAALNPISSVIKQPFKFTFDYGADNGEAAMLHINPVVPVSVGDWSVVNRVQARIGQVTGPISGLPGNPSPIPGDGASGLTDINWSAFLSPPKVGKVNWGAGLSLNIPTAVDDQLGTGKWSAGPTGVILLQPNWGSYGILGRQLWSFTGDITRRDVNQTVIEPFASYKLDKGWYLTTDMNIIVNWEARSANKWTVPLGGGVGRVFTIGKQDINSKFETYYNIVQPDGALDWRFSFSFQFLFPKKR